MVLEEARNRVVKPIMHWWMVKSQWRTFTRGQVERKSIPVKAHQQIAVC
jgi:hypothetical protein